MKHNKQIAMRWERKEPTPHYFPDEYTVVHYDGSERQRKEFFRLWNNRYGTDKEAEDAFNNCFVHYHDCQPEKDVFFVKKEDEYVGTITAIHHPRNNSGYVHMVAIRDDYRGRRLSKALNYLAMKKIYDDGSDFAVLTTNEWRENAIRSYIKTGFLPMMNEFWPKWKKVMVGRWLGVYEKLELGELKMVTPKGKPLDWKKYTK